MAENPQLKGFVIITLPPPDNPSLGKTITAFTLSDSSPLHPPLQQQQELQIQQQIQQQSRFSFKKAFTMPRGLLFLLGTPLLLFLLWGCFYSDTPFEFSLSSEDADDDDERRELNTFLFPLFPKNSDSQTDVELKLGSFVMRDDTEMAVGIDGVKYQRNSKVGSSSEINSTTIFPIRGNIYPDGLYYTSMRIGNPPRPYFLDVDTGSDLTWIQCDAPCISCAKGPNPLYKPTKGKIVPCKDSLCIEVQSNQNPGHDESCKQCDYEIEYSDHSSSMGVLARDDMLLMTANGTSVKSSFVFGCAYDQQGQLLGSPAKTDGILGLSSAKVSLPSQLASQGIISNVVGHCITSDVSGGGYMFLGDGFLPRSGMTWIPLLDSPSMKFYHAKVSKITFGGQQLGLGGMGNNVGRVVFDSGSTYSYFTKEAYTSLIASLKDVSREGLIEDKSDPTLPVCWRANFPIRSLKDVKQFFKPLTIDFGTRWWVVSTKLLIPPEGYLIISGKGNVCLGILDGSTVQDGSTNILGDISLRGQLVVYDNVKQKIGWVQSDCAVPRKPKSLTLI
eukprot:TRINITY_DN1557_c0_g1_i1.p1 TRINITY_DN1557_c0_g1~~TRINITY_DN1557_c0_g1_i1.p1  ORF type:complete len:559 (-),score=68.28 TRINITY_DN1557_c0_g1_i1:277-1953(-)